MAPVGKRQRTWRAASLMLSLLLLWPVSATASFFGTIYSGATTGDPAALFWNPAALTLMQGTTGMLLGGVSPIRVQYWRSTPNPFDGELYPKADLNTLKPDIGFALVSDAGLDRWRFGVGFGVPLLDGADWLYEYGGKEASTRFFSLKAQQVHVWIQPAVAYRINRYVSLGFGVDIVGAWLKQGWVTDFGAQINHLACSSNPSACQVGYPIARENPAFDAPTSVEGWGWSAGIGGGVLVTPARWMRLGLGIHSGGGSITVPVDMRVELPATVKKYAAQKLKSIKLPEITAKGEVQTFSPMVFTAGAVILPHPKLEIAADFIWSQNSKMAVMYGRIVESATTLISDQVLVKDLTDDWQLSLRASYRVLPRLNVAFRVDYDPNIRPERMVTPVSIDFNKLHLQLGLAWRATDWFTAIVEYGHFFLFSREITQSNFGPNANPTTPEEQGLDRPYPLGRYEGMADRVAASLLFHF